MRRGLLLRESNLPNNQDRVWERRDRVQCQCQTLRSQALPRRRRRMKLRYSRCANSDNKSNRTPFIRFRLIHGRGALRSIPIRIRRTIRPRRCRITPMRRLQMVSRDPMSPRSSPVQIRERARRVVSGSRISSSRGDVVYYLNYCVIIFFPCGDSNSI